MNNTFGNILQLTTFGESHGKAIGGIISGFPAGVIIDIKQIQQELDRRKPGQSKITTQRNESDTLEILSGISQANISLGTPIGFVIPNKNQHSNDYDNLKNIYRPSHADYTYEHKYGLKEHNGGGRSSARETACRIVGGGFAKFILDKYNINVYSYVHQVGKITCLQNYTELNLSKIEDTIVRCPEKDTADKMINAIEEAKQNGNSLGGIIVGVIKNCPVGLGEPIYNKLHAALGNAMLSINAVKGFDYGLGFNGVHLYGSEVNDEFTIENNIIKTKTNNSGGIQGGISNGMDIYFRVAFKPTSTIFIEQNTITNEGENVSYKPDGRHDPCVLPRAVPIVDAMAKMVIADFILMNRISKI